MGDRRRCRTGRFDYRGHSPDEATLSPDIPTLIENILSDKRLVGNENLAPKIYRDEPVLMTAAQMERRLPQKYRDMRRIAGKRRLSYETHSRIFYEQGRFMEDFVDDFTYTGDFVRYFPTYQDMSDNQLRGYFSWRSRVRRGCVEQTSLSFAFIYLYELLNGIGASTPEQIFTLLKDFGAAYEPIDPGIKPYLRVWLRDYVVFHNLDSALLEGLPDCDCDAATAILLRHGAHTVEEVFCSLQSLSSYRLEKSRFFKQYPEDVTIVACGVFAALAEYYGKRNKKSLCERFFGLLQATSYVMFQSAVVYQPSMHPDCLYTINSAHQYRCDKGKWTCERFFPYQGPYGGQHAGRNRHIGALLKNIDSFMRLKYGFKHALQPEKPTKLLQEIIFKQVDTLRAERERAARPPRPVITIDVTKLRDIRSAALETQNKLLVEEEGVRAAADTSEQKACPHLSDNWGSRGIMPLAGELEGAEPPQKFVSVNTLGLSAIEQQFMLCLLYDKPYDALLRSCGLPLSVLVDAVNERLFDLFGDTVIRDEGDRAAVLEEYVDDLKGRFKE